MVRVRQNIGRACALLCASAVLFGSDSAIASGGGRNVPVGAPSDASSYSATLEQCTTSSNQLERSATVTGEIIAGAATTRMGMRIELQQRANDTEPFRTIVAPGLGDWRYSEPGVKLYKYVKQLTTLAAPASYRAIVRFRWLGAHGRLLKRAELRTATCEQPLLGPPAPPPASMSASSAR